MPENKKQEFSGSSKLAKLINLCLEKNIPFVSFRLPDEKNIQTMIQLSGKFSLFETVKEASGKSGFIYAPFHRKTNLPVVLFEPELIIENDNFTESQRKEIAGKPIMYPDQSFKPPFESGKEEYLEQADSFIQSFNKVFTKAVLSRVHVENKPESFDPGQFFIHAQEKYPSAFCHLINIPGAGTWAGATPEIFLKIDKETVQTMSLAGTQLKNATAKEVQWKIKEMEEQRFVSNYIIEIFKRFGIHDFQIDGPQTIQAGNALHLSTKFCFSKSYIQDQLADFIENFHPTPAVCGLPKTKALELIFRTEKHNREYYSGFCGPLNMEERTDLFVNLRCMKILKQQLALFVGGGLTAKSVPEKEWEETQLKTETLLNLILKH
jgi:isochorismate synthase